MNIKTIDISGKKFGRITVLKYAYSKNYRAYWLCKCDCGKEFEIQANNKRNNIKSNLN